MKRTLLFLSLLLSASLFGQTSLDIAVAKYGASYADSTKTVGQKYAAGQDTLNLKWAWAHCKARGMNYATFRTRYFVNAAILDIAWTNEAPNNLKNRFQNTLTFATLPFGKFKCNVTITMPRAGMQGGSSFVYAGVGGDQGQVATELVMDDATWWPSTDKERRLVESPNANYVGNLGYNESFTIQGIRLTGPKKKGDGITRIGWYIKKPGSTTWINQVQANGFNKGFVNIDGVPVVYGTIRAFECDVAGWSGEGTWGADITILKLECDGCGRAFQLVQGSDGNNAGGTLRIGLKVEDGVTAGIAAPGTIAGWLEGQYCVEVFINSSYANGVKPPHLFVINPTVGKDANGNEQLQGSLLTVQGKGYGYGKLLKNNVTGQEWSGPGDYQAYRFEHYSNGDKLTTGCPGIKSLSGGTVIPPTGTTGTPTPTTPLFTVNNLSTATNSKNVAPAGTNCSRVKITSFKPSDVAFGWITDKIYVSSGDLNVFEGGVMRTVTSTAVKDAAGNLVSKLVAGSTYTIDYTYSSPQPISNYVGGGGPTLVFGCQSFQVW